MDKNFVIVEEPRKSFISFCTPVYKVYIGRLVWMDFCILFEILSTSFTKLFGISIVYILEESVTISSLVSFPAVYCLIYSTHCLLVFNANVLIS